MNNGMNVEEKQESIAQRVKARTNRRMTFVSRVEAVWDSVLQFLAKNPLFVEHSLHTIKKGPHSAGYSLSFGMDRDTYITLALYSGRIFYPITNGWFGKTKQEMEEAGEGEETFELSAEIPRLYSSLEHATGFFLLHLAMAIAIASGAIEIKLDNDTGDPIRATKGIYRLFTYNSRSSPFYMSKENEDKMAERVHIVSSDSIEQIRRAVVERVRVEVERGGGGIWRPDAVEKIDRLFQGFKQGMSLRGGKRRKTGKRRGTGKKTKRDKSRSKRKGRSMKILRR